MLLSWLPPLPSTERTRMWNGEPEINCAPSPSPNPPALVSAEAAMRAAQLNTTLHASSVQVFTLNSNEKFRLTSEAEVSELF